VGCFRVSGSLSEWESEWGIEWIALCGKYPEVFGMIVMMRALGGAQAQQ